MLVEESQPDLAIAVILHGTRYIPVHQDHEGGHCLGREGRAAQGSARNTRQILDETVTKTLLKDGGA